MSDLGGGIGLPQMSEREMFENLLGEDSERDGEEPEIAARIGEQMLHMNLQPLPRSTRVRIRDIISRIPARNVVLVGGGIGHLSAWLLDLWCGDPAEPQENPPQRPDSFTIVEEGGKFGVIIDRLIRRYDASSWTRVITQPWLELSAETQSWLAASTTIPDSANPSLLPLPMELAIVDLDEERRPEAAKSAFDLLAPGGILIALEPEVPTGDVGEIEAGKDATEAQRLVASFNRWMEFVRSVDEEDSAAFVEMRGGTIGVFRRST